MNAVLLRSEQLGNARNNTMEDDEDDGFSTFLLIGLGARVYATEVANVREIVDLAEISPLPNAPHDVFGMIDLRDQSIPVIDLAARMQIETNPEDDARIVVFEFGSHDAVKLLGIIADRVISVREVTKESIERLSHAASGWQNDGVVGVMRTDDTQALVLKIEHYLDDVELPGEFDFDKN